MSVVKYISLLKDLWTKPLSLLGTLIKIQNETALKCNCRNIKEKISKHDRWTFRHKLYRWRLIYTEPVPLPIFYQAYHENKTLIMKHCLFQKQWRDWERGFKIYTDINKSGLVNLWALRPFVSLSASLESQEMPKSCSNQAIAYESYDIIRHLLHPLQPLTPAEDALKLCLKWTNTRESKVQLESSSWKSFSSLWKQSQLLCLFSCTLLCSPEAQLQITCSDTHRTQTIRVVAELLCWRSTKQSSMPSINAQCVNVGQQKILINLI